MTRTPGGARCVVLTDADSYVKWGAHVAGQLPADWQVRFLIARGSTEPNQRQVREALNGSRFTPEQAEHVTLRELQAVLSQWKPDVVLLAMRGLAVRAALDSAIIDAPDRPVLVSGLPGISFPVFSTGLRFRRGVDLYVLHSRREVRAFTHTAEIMGIRHRFELATLPFAGPAESDRPRDRIVFAAQAKVPARKQQRLWLLEQLALTARAHPELEVVVKIRAAAGEPQTHDEMYPYDALLARMADPPPNLVVESGSMREHLARAVALVSVSSTALLEAVAAGVPCLALTDFGVDAQHINTVFLDSGLLGASDELVAARFRKPASRWLADNYFHGIENDTWVAAIEELLAKRAVEGLPPHRDAPLSIGRNLVSRYSRQLAFSRSRGSVRDRLERAVWFAVLRGHGAATRTSNRLARRAGGDGRGV